MPELPEVETTISDLKNLEGFTILSIKLYRRNLRYIIPKKTNIIAKNAKILIIYRKAKYIIFKLDNGYSLIIHLGMSGRIKCFNIDNSPKLEKNDHVEVFLSNNLKIILNDPRRFGIFDIIKSRQIKKHRYFSKLGLDPFSKNFSLAYLSDKLRNSKSNIKIFLLNQRIITGIGNIYACEILFDCKISPLKITNTISDNKTKKLYNSIIKILKKAIKNRGSSIRDYRSIDGKLGNFQNNFIVYNKAGEYLKFSNKKLKIVKIIQSGRSTFYCPSIQK